MFSQKDKMRLLEVQSCKNEVFLFDVHFTAKEMSRAVNRLKRRKALGLDGLMAKHLKAGGDAVITRLIKILNDVVVLEVVPEVSKSDVTVRIYKRGWRDPLKVNSYRRITLTSMVSKVLEFLLLERLDLLFMEAGLPHVNQSAYRKAVS